MKEAPQNSIKPEALKQAKLAVISSRFNEGVCDGLIKGANQVLEENHIVSDQIDHIRVPGAFEIPVAAAHCARQKKYQGLICLGAVIKGETPHFDYICQSVAMALQQLSVEAVIPVGFGIITTNSLEQAHARSADDACNKGREASLAVLEMLGVLHG